VIGSQPALRGGNRFLGVVRVEIRKSLEGTRILLVEDDRLLRLSLALYFQIRGCTVVAFESSEDAMTAIERDRFDIAIVDQMLPGMNGLDFLEKLSLIRPDISRILITGQPGLEIAEKVTRQKVDDFLWKPFSPAEMEESIRRLADRRRRAETRREGMNFENTV